MYLKRLHLVNFKNTREANLSFIPGLNCLVGNNGAGKTNLLDAIYFLSFCKSHFNSLDNQLIMHGEDFFLAHGRYDFDGQPEDIRAGFKRNQKKQFARDKKDYQRLSDHVGLIPLVMISPGDERIITEGADQRRKFIDSVISQVDKEYLELLLQFNRVVAQRNALLKSAGGQEGNLKFHIETWDQQLVAIGNQVFYRRTKFLNEITPIIQKYHKFISGDNDDVRVIYNSHHEIGDVGQLLRERLVRDLVLGYTSIGAHRDDLELTLNGHPVRKEGSQGQKKTFFIAMKLAQFEYIKTYRGFEPILLLDDLFDKLDQQRGDKLVELTGSNLFGQIFITDTQKNRLRDIVVKTGRNFAIFEVENGNATLC